MRLILSLILSLWFLPAFAGTLNLPPGMISLNSPAGQQIFLQSTARTAYWPLSAQFETQENQAFCGVASLVMVLNSLDVPAPVSTTYAPYRYFTQDDFFPPDGTTIFQAQWIEHHGLTLDQLGTMARHFGVSVQVVHATANGLPQFRAQAAKALATPGQYVVINYRRTSLNEEGYGHISPLAAYDSKSDRFLLLDVARYKYPPAWVRAADLYAALDTPDPGNGNATRGYLILSMAK